MCGVCVWTWTLIAPIFLLTPPPIGKVEECPTHIKSVMNEMRHLFGANFSYDCISIAEFEFFLMEDLDFYTIVYHPYRPLQKYVPILTKSYLNFLSLEKNILQTARLVQSLILVLSLMIRIGPIYA